MKTFNEKHEAIITTISCLKGEKEPKDGEMAEHIEKAYSIEFYVPHSRNDGTFIKVSVGTDFIIDLYNQIQEIQQEVVVRPYCELPF